MCEMANRTNDDVRIGSDGAFTNILSGQKLVLGENIREILPLPHHLYNAPNVYAAITSKPVPGITLKVIDEDLESFWASPKFSNSNTIDLKFDKKIQFDILEISEPIKYGQRIKSFEISVETNSGWKIYFCDISFQFRQFLKMFPHLIYQGLILRQQGRVGELVHLQYFTMCMDICFDNILLHGFCFDNILLNGYLL